MSALFLKYYIYNFFQVPILIFTLQYIAKLIYDLCKHILLIFMQNAVYLHLLTNSPLESVNSIHGVVPKRLPSEKNCAFIAAI